MSSSRMVLCQSRALVGSPPPQAVDVREPLVRLAPDDRVRRALCLFEELVDQARRLSPLERRPLAGEAQERHLVARGLGDAQHAHRVPRALVRVGDLEVQERARVPRRPGGLCLPVPRPVVGLGAKRPLVELAQREVVRALAMSVGDSRGAPVRVVVRGEASRAHGVDDGLDPFGPTGAPRVEPAEGVVDVAAAQRDALGEE